MTQPAEYSREWFLQRASESAAKMAELAGAFEAPIATGELFDPSVGNGLWTPIPVEPSDARSFANATAEPANEIEPMSAERTIEIVSSQTGSTA